MNYPDDYINKIIQGDCLEVMKGIPDNSVDLVLTDPPYNAKNIGPKSKIYDTGQMQLPLEDYINFCHSWYAQCERIAKTVVFSPGISNIAYYPQPKWIICWYKPAAVSFNRMGGYNAWEPISVYGKATSRIPYDVIKFNTTNHTKGIEAEHPCPKPLGLWSQLVEKFSNKGDTVLDPFLGSGTTAVACKMLDRNYIGIELSEKYCEIARDRIENTLPLFDGLEAE